MNNLSKFKHLKDIASELNRKLDLLMMGSLSKQELENLTDESRELYERLVVLRYKAYDDEVKGEAAPVEQIVIEEPEAREPIAFKIEEPKADVPIQVSLIDAIEEVAKNEELAAIEEPSIENTEEHLIETIISDHITTNPAPSGNVGYVPGNHIESLHDRLSKSFTNTETLAERLEHNPIADLKKAISLNQRFQFSKELFKGNNQDYEVAIDKLNNLTREDALKHLESLRNKYAWSNESAVTTDFVGLIERRHS